MSHQLTFADSEFSTKRRQTRKEIFLSRMEHILPWQDLITIMIQPLRTILRVSCSRRFSR